MNSFSAFNQNKHLRILICFVSEEFLLNWVCVEEGVIKMLVRNSSTDDEQTPSTEHS